MKASHERFNVFTTLLDAHDEVCLHTRFLHCLLDPKSCHDCNSLFLGLFFETLTELPCEDHDGGPVTLNLPTSKQLWTVEIEGPRDGVGRIDLLLKL